MMFLRIFVMLLFVVPAIAHAEGYIGAQIGGVFPSTISSADATGPLIGGAGLPAGSTLSNVDLKNSIMGGGKAGYWFTKQGLSWLGLETNLQYAQPDIAAQNIQT